MGNRGWIGLALIVGGCGGDVDLGLLSRTDAWIQSPTDQVDILWVVDNSNSMQLEQTLLGQGFTTFAEELQNTNTDFHIGVITTDFDYEDAERGQLIANVPPGTPAVITKDDPDYVDHFIERAQVGLNGSGKEKGLEAAKYALSPAMTTGPNAGFLRGDANLLVVAVSDEEDCSDNGKLELDDSEACYSKQDQLTPIDEFVTFFKGLKQDVNKVKFSAIVGPENATSICDETTLPGRRYLEVASLLGGTAGSICETNWSEMLYQLGLNAVGIYTTFTLSHGAYEGTLVVTVDGVVVPESEVDGYTYDPEAFTITFHGAAIPPRGSEINAEYDIQPGT